MLNTIYWGGTDAERLALLQALEHNCTCTIGQDGARTDTCGSHQLLLDQRALDRLLFGKRLATRLGTEEFRANGIA